MVITTPSTIMFVLTCDNYKAENAFWGIFGPTVILTFDFLTPKFNVFIFILESFNGKSLVKCRQKTPNISC